MYQYYNDIIYDSLSSEFHQISFHPCHHLKEVSSLSVNVMLSV